MKKKISYLVFFVLLLAIYRLIPHAPNFTPIIAAAIVGPMLLKDRLYGIAIPIIAMFVSDLIIGFHPYQFVVYSSIILISLFSPLYKNYFRIGLISLTGSVWFYISTNFAVWLMWDYYPKTFEGLISCYVLAIPFFYNTILSTCLFTVGILFLIKFIEVVNRKTFKFSYQ